MLRIKKFIFISVLLFPLFSAAQKKPLDHSVYDGWQSARFLQLSDNGKYLAYMICPQEGDSLMVLKHKNGNGLAEIPRGYAGKFTKEGNYFVCKIKPFYKAIRQAKIDKKKSDEMPKDSLAIVNLLNGKIEKIADVKSFRLPEKAGPWLAYTVDISEKKKEKIPKKDSVVAITTLQRNIDSLQQIVKLAQAKGLNTVPVKKDTPQSKADTLNKNQLIVKNLLKNIVLKYNNAEDCQFSAKGNYVAISLKDAIDTTKKKAVAVVNLHTLKTDTILRSLNDVRSMIFDEKEHQLAFIAEKDSSEKSLLKFYDLYYYTPKNNVAQKIATRHSKGMKQGWGISENSRLKFSKKGDLLFFGTNYILPLKDTALPEFERVNVDIWSHKDYALQTMQLSNLKDDLKRSFQAVWNVMNDNLYQLEDSTYSKVDITEEGDGKYFYLISTNAYTPALQWAGYLAKDIYVVNSLIGDKKLIIKNFEGNTYDSYTGKYLLLYDANAKKYSIYNAEKNDLKTVDIPYPVYDEDNDMPMNPDNHGIAGWTRDDAFVLIYDRYDTWKVDVATGKSSLLFPSGRAGKISSRYIKVDDDEKFIDLQSPLYFSRFSEETKQNLYAELAISGKRTVWRNITEFQPVKYRSLTKAKDARVFLYTKENYIQSPDVYVHAGKEIKLSSINPQQVNYNWGTAELFKWTAYTGKLTEGIVYKPEDFDASKKYPMIVYFYERNNETLYDYIAPAPTPSRLNISFFVSRGYIVFVPDIWYKTGYPGQSAYDYIVSGTRALTALGYVDSTRLGLQGQSWGGYQTAHLITRTNLYKAAWAGAPVVNMFSAYGGIRWQTGMNRQFQYEKTQSRIGATIWEKPELYKENSPLFYVPAINTPLVIMHNDNDGAVPWYQGIEMFTAMRRLDKPVWLLNYNDEEHNLMQRKNRKDISVREQQFFDWLLKDAPPAPWLRDGVPAIMKGRTWGL
ncbi:alpha/beta hydrolase family protein [Haoranjiania flava]|uniref:Prolyl oligopeptidase family serine peptidase n=1 Tax=Haoranjiania flava TaxID=1856322 RepID=A0AAE3IL33_9BACT|nr:prolyl oligopeptidase family serine peptidase [Haoranjiania flava]MCU7693649.1 prolyl oligopeptidase family serine peptidase [Haoranjiania flava]